MRGLPYQNELDILEKRNTGKERAAELMRGIANGAYRPVLNARKCRRHHVGRSFRKRKFLSGRSCSAEIFSDPTNHKLFLEVFEHCIKFEPRERPDMESVASRLEDILEESKASSTSVACTGNLPTVTSAELGQSIQTSPSIFNPWREGFKVEQSMRSFASRVRDVEHRQPLQELCKQVETLLGPKATNASTGVYNAVRLYRFLLINELDVQDARTMVVMNAKARQEYKMDEKRARIVNENLGLEDFPYAREFLEGD